MPSEIVHQTFCSYRAEECTFQTIATLPAGWETCFHYRYEVSDGTYLTLTRKWSGIHQPLSQKQRLFSASGFPPLPREGEELYLPSGKYRQIQHAPLQNDQDLAFLMLPLALFQTEGECYLRFSKQAGNVTMRLLLPLEK